MDEQEIKITGKKRMKCKIHQMNENQIQQQNYNQAKKKLTMLELN